MTRLWIIRYAPRPTAAASSCSIPFSSMQSRGLHRLRENPVSRFSGDITFLSRFPRPSSSSWALLQLVWNDVPHKPTLSRVCRQYSILSNSMFGSLGEHTLSLQTLHLHRKT